MKFISLIALSLILTSCWTVSFNQPQPKDGQRLKEIPEELQGKWIKNNGASLMIDATGIGTMNIIVEVDSLNNNIVDTSYNYYRLSDSIRIYRGGKYYVYNELRGDGAWGFAVTKVDFKGNIYNYYCDDVKFYRRLKGLKVDSVSYILKVDSVFNMEEDHLHDIDELIISDTIVYNPTVKELSKIDNYEIQWIFFNGQIRVKDLHKITVRKNLISIYKVDGTIEVKRLLYNSEEGSSAKE